MSAGDERPAAAPAMAQSDGCQRGCQHGSHRQSHWHHHHEHAMRRHAGVRGRLHRQIYLAFIGVVIVCFVLAMITGHVFWSPLVGATPHGPLHGGLLRLLCTFGVLVAGMAALTYPVARRIAWRLERLEQGVERFGQGDLSSRVEVLGHDEVADVARAFNRAADRIDVLVQQQKRMLASASHELRAPLARLRMALELLLDDGASPSPARRAELLQTCSQDIEELDTLVGDVLLAARLENATLPHSMARIELAPLLRGEVERAGARIEGALPEVRGEGDARLLRHMLRNLLDNARKHGGDTVSVALSPCSEGVRIEVRDDGAGIPEAERERIFEPFYRPQGHSEAHDGGVGLGLSLVRQVAVLHGGQARCLERPGGGTCFEVVLAGFEVFT